MTDEQIQMAQALGRVTYPVGSTHKRFARAMAARANLASPAPLSERQVAQLQRLAWRYRRQMPVALVPAEKPE